MLDRVLESINDAALPEGEPRIEGRHMSVVVVPHKGKAPKPEATKAGGRKPDAQPQAPEAQPAPASNEAEQQ